MKGDQPTMKNRVTQNRGPHKLATRNSFTLSPTNARRLRLAARTVRIDPARFLNDWLLKERLSELEDPSTGAMRALVEGTVYDGADEAKKAAGAVVGRERRQGCRFGRLATAVK
jgi:hypothetical protein